MENNSNEREDRYEPQPSLNGQNMDRENPVDSYIDNQIPKDGRHEEFEEEEKHAEWPFSKLHQRISDVPNGDKENTEIAAEKESPNDEPKTDRITSIQKYTGNGHL